MAFNREAMGKGTWVISSLGADTCIIEVLPSSPWPELRERGYSLQWIEDDQRILPREYRSGSAFRRRDQALDLRG